MLSLVMRYASLALQSRSSHCIFSFALKKISVDQMLHQDPIVLFLLR